MNHPYRSAEEMKADFEKKNAQSNAIIALVKQQIVQSALEQGQTEPKGGELDGIACVLLLGSVVRLLKNVPLGMLLTIHSIIERVPRNIASVAALRMTGLDKNGPVQ